MSPEARKLLHGHEKRLAYRMDKADSIQLCYECKSLGFREIQTFSKRRSVDLSAAPVRRTWHIDGSDITYTSLEQVAEVLLRGFRPKRGINEQKYGNDCNSKHAKS